MSELEKAIKNLSDEIANSEEHGDSIEESELFSTMKAMFESGKRIPTDVVEEEIEYDGEYDDEYSGEKADFSFDIDDEDEDTDGDERCVGCETVDTTLLGLPSIVTFALAGILVGGAIGVVKKILE